MSQQYNFGETDLTAVKEDAAKLEGEFLSIPSPGQMVVRACPPWSREGKIPYYQWIMHYNLRVEGFDGIHVCAKQFGDSSCPICAIVSKLYDLSVAPRDYFAKAAYDVRAGARYYWNMIPNVVQQEVFNPDTNQKVLISDSMQPDVKILPYAAGETTQKHLTRQMTDYGPFTNPFMGNDIRFVREPSGKQEAKFAPTQVYILPQKTCVSARLVTLMSTAMPQLNTLFNRTETDILKQIAQLYYEKIMEGAGIRSGSSVTMPNNPVGQQGFGIPIMPTGLPPAPPPTPPAAPGQPPQLFSAPAMVLPHQIPTQASAQSNSTGPSPGVFTDSNIPLGALDAFCATEQKTMPPSVPIANTPAAPVIIQSTNVPFSIPRQ